LEENTPLDYAIYGVLWAYEQCTGMVQKLRGENGQQMPASSDDMLADLLLIVLLSALHLLVIGPSRSGKTSLVHALALRWRLTSRVIVCDPDAAPGLWTGCEVFGAGDNFAAIDKALASLAQEITARREQRARGIRQFPPLRVVLCEYADIARYCDQARTIIEDCLRRGGKLGISLVLDVQDKQRKTLDLDGATHLLQNFSHVCEVRRSPGGSRTATVTANDGEQTVITYDIPTLPDLDDLVAQHAVSTVSQLTSMVQPLLNEGFPPSVLVPVRDGTDGTESIRMPNTASITLPTDDEANAIRYLLQHLGSKNKVAEFLGGSKTTAYKRINRALGEEE
jgi:GTPase SAR1 family protein